MIFFSFYLIIYFFLSLLCLFLFCGLCAFKFLLFIFLSAVFISLWLGLGLIFSWSENKISYFGVVYKSLSVGMELAKLKNYLLFCIFNIYIYIYIYIYWLIYCIFSVFIYLFIDLFIVIFLKVYVVYICLCNIFTIHICLLLMCCYQYVVMCFSVCDINLNVYVWGP